MRACQVYTGFWATARVDLMVALRRALPAFGQRPGFADRARLIEPAPRNLVV